MISAGSQTKGTSRTQRQNAKGRDETSFVWKEGGKMTFVWLFCYKISCKIGQPDKNERGVNFSP